MPWLELAPVNDHILLCFFQFSLITFVSLSISMQPKWNDALLEMFRNEYIGSAPYVSCLPSLCHYKLGANDQFLVLSSDGLYQYLCNEEVVLYVESFMERFPDGDPAQSLIEELLFRAAQKAGKTMFLELSFFLKSNLKNGVHKL